MNRANPLIVTALAALLAGGCAATRDAVDEVGDETRELAADIQSSETWQNIEQNWGEFKAAAAERWNDLTEDDLDDVAGNREDLIEEVHESYAMTRAEAEAEVDDWADSM